jgi:cytochrome P450
VQFSEILQFFLQPGNANLWEQIQDLVTSDSPTTDSLLKQYVLEAQRMVSTQRNLRICHSATTIDGQEFKKGDTVICLFVSDISLKSDSKEVADLSI